MISKLKYKKLEIFCGTGGVGKTTLAATRAIFLASQQLRVLIMTIDPAKRLKETLQLDQANHGDLVKVNSSILAAPSFQNEFNLYAQLMNPEKTLKQMAFNADNQDLINNPIVKILAKPFAGLNEILSLIELQYHFDSNQFDVIILDTPPGNHFLDFLEGVEKINTFFDQKFLDYFMSPQNVAGKNSKFSQLFKPSGLVGLVVGAGVKKLLDLLAIVTGQEFVSQFTGAINAIYRTKNQFLKALEFEKTLKDSKITDWFLVTSASQNKINEAVEMKSVVEKTLGQSTKIIVNKSLWKELKDFSTLQPTQLEDESLNYSWHLMKMLKEKEMSLMNILEKNFSEIRIFPEIFKTQSTEQIKELIPYWNDKKDI